MNKKFICETDGLRLDKFLVEKLSYPRNQIENAIKMKLVLIDDKLETKAGTKLKIGSIIEFLEPEIEKSITHNVNFDIEILYEDEHLMVLNKPNGLTVHGAPSVKEATLVDWLKSKNISLSTLSGEERHGIVHRLDKGTSGAIAIAKTNQAHAHLSSQLEQKTMGRYYLAVIDLPLKDNCIIEKNIGRNPNNRLKMDVVENGRYAKTAFSKICNSKNSELELIAAKLFTGRTHQIRVHLKTLQRHIIGDSLYGFKGEINKIDMIFLHAYCIYFEHPISKKIINVVAPLQNEMENLIKQKFNQGDLNEKLNKDFIINSFNSFT